jgi:hypothetical protein
MLFVIVGGTTPCMKEARQVRSNIKSMMMRFSDCEGTVHQKFVPPDQKVNQHYYKEESQSLRKQVHQKHPE